MNLSVTTVMLPRWTLEETFHQLAAAGYNGMELRCRYYTGPPDAEPGFWGRHVADVSPDNLVDRAAEIRALIAETGVRVAALAPAVTLGEWDPLEKLAAGAKAIDADCPPMIRVGALRHDRNKPYLPQFLAARAGFAELVEWARQRGVKILYEIHVGTVAVTASRAYELLRDLDPHHLGAIYDVPNMCRVGLEDTRMGLEILGPYLAHCHIGNGRPVAGEPDERGVIPWSYTFCDLQGGIANIAQIVADMQAVGYQGFLSLEDFGPGDDAEKIRTQGAYLRSLLEPV
jgi:sugar phosphate isomerase/epimerase